MTQEPYAYTARENLETVAAAVNYNRYQRNFIKAATQNLNLTRSVNVLDFGAGIGTYADMVRNTDVNVDCFEIDRTEVKLLQKKGYKVYSKIDEVQTKYDVIYSLNVLEHIEDDLTALLNLKDCLAQGGIIVIYVPAFMLIFTKLDVLAEHYRRYRIHDMKRLANGAGLRVKEIKYCDQVGFFAALAYRLISGDGKLSPKSTMFFDRVLFPLNKLLEPVLKKVLGKNVLVIYESKP